MIDFLMSGGNFMFQNEATAGMWGLIENCSISNSAPAGVSPSYAFRSGSSGMTMKTPNLGTNFGALIAGIRIYMSNLTSIVPLIAFLDSNALPQCDLRINGSGQFYFTRNGTTIGSTSSYAIAAGAWAYIEFKAILSASGAGVCEVRVNGNVVLSSSSLTNAQNTGSYVYGATASVVEFNSPAIGGDIFFRDFYVVDTVNGVNTSYLGDINVLEVYPNGPGVNSAWSQGLTSTVPPPTAPPPPFTVTAVSGSGSSWTFTGSWTEGAANAFIGYNFNTTSCGTGNNQTSVQCTASAAGSITLNFSGGSAQSGLTGSAAFECIVEIGINNSGTRPNGDVAYIYDSTPGDISDFVHQSLNAALGHNFSGVILGIAHLSYLRKDDAGSRSVAQVCLSSSATAVGPTISLGNTYVYYTQILEVDPNTSSQWSAANFNLATFGTKLVA